MSTEKFVVKTSGRILSVFGREGTNSHFRGGTIFNDATTDIIWVENQISLGACETIMGKETTLVVAMGAGCCISVELSWR